MKKMISLMILLAVLFSIAAVKPPRLVRLEIVNKSGEPVYIELTGTGYDFGEQAFKWHGGSYWWLPYQDPPMDAVGEYLNVTAYGMYTVPSDLYQIKIWYQQEIDDTSFKCVTNWVPLQYVDSTAYFALDRNRKIVIPPCNQIPSVLPGPKNDQIKWARWLLVVK